MNTQKNVFVCVGPPCSSKGTQSRILADSIGASRIEAGEQLNRIIQGEISPELSQAAAKVRTNVRAISATDLDAISRAQLGSEFGDDSQDVVLDGFGRNQNSYELLCKVFGRENFHFLLFNVSSRVMHKRAVGRFIDPSTRESYMGLDEQTAHSRGLIRRDSDKPRVLNRRFASFKANTLPVVNAHQHAGGSVISVNAGQPNIEEVTSEMFKRIQEQLPGIEFNVS